MSQAAIAPLNPATTSGTDLADKLVDFEQAVLTQHSGTSAPSYIAAGTLWLDTTTDPYVWNFYNGVQNVPLAKFDITSHRRQYPVNETSIASAATTDVLGSSADVIVISGSATITSLGSEPNQIKFVRATGAFTLTHNATTLVLPTGANITAANGDNFIVVSNSLGNPRIYGYQRQTGAALASATTEIPSGSVMLFFSSTAPTGWTKDTTNYNNHAIRIVTGSITSTGPTFPVANSLPFTTVFGKTATDSHILTEAQLPSHDHAQTVHAHGAGTLNLVSTALTINLSNATSVLNNKSQGNNLTGGGANTYVQDAEEDDITASGNLTSDTMQGSTANSAAVNTGTAGSGSGHTHDMDIRLRYADAIRATKD